jgi:hypothetical protein
VELKYRTTYQNNVGLGQRNAVSCILFNAVSCIIFDAVSCVLFNAVSCITWYGHVQRMAEGRLPKIALKWMPKQRRARGRPKKWMEGIKKAMNGRACRELTVFKPEGDQGVGKTYAEVASVI